MTLAACIVGAAAGECLGACAPCLFTTEALTCSPFQALPANCLQVSVASRWRQLFEYRCFSVDFHWFDFDRTDGIRIIRRVELKGIKKTPQEHTSGSISSIYPILMCTQIEGTLD